MGLTDERTILQAICDVLEEIDGLHAYTFPLANMETPFVVPHLLADYDNTWDGQQSMWRCNLKVMTKVGDVATGGEEMLDLFSATGAGSIHQKLINNRSLDGAVGNIRSVGPSDDASIVYNSDGIALYWIRTFVVEIYV